MLTISLLCSGREGTKKCLDSLETLRKRVPSELILVDTGCGEETKKLLFSYADEVIPFTWCNDFSKARNAGLEKADGEWFLFLDDDEWFFDTVEIEEFFLSGEYRDYRLASYIVRNYLDKEGFTYEDSEPDRLICLREGIRFEGIIHETFSSLSGPKKRFSSMAGHFGYVFQTLGEERKHSERNRGLLERALTQDEENVRMWIQLAQQYNADKDYENLQEFCRRALHKFEDRNDSIINRERGCFYCGLVNACICLGKIGEAEKAYEGALADKRNTDFCIARLMAFGAEIFKDNGEKKKIRECCQHYFSLWEHYKMRQEELRDQDTIFVRTAFYQIVRNNMYSYQICFDLENGNTVSLKKYFGDFGWDSGKVYMTEDFMPCLVRAMARLPYEEIFVHAADVLANKPGMDNFWEEIDRIEDEGEVRQLVGILSETAGEFGERAGKYLKKMQEAEERDDWEGFSAALKEAAAACPQLAGVLKRCAQCYAGKRMRRAEEAEKEILNISDASEADGCITEESGNCQTIVSAEMQALAAQIKAQISVLLSQGMKNDALQALRQLKTFMPEDKELLELENSMLH